ncbi:MAG: hypothetical protein J6A67_04925 [Clostridia bacterium]|nr:hypothetical protein [Clostridia bacterium]
MSVIFSKITAFFMSIVTAISLLPINLVKTVTSDDGLIAKIGFSAYNQRAEKFCENPDTDSDFVPQGLAYSDYLDKVLICGYMNTEGNSRIYVVDPESGETEKYISLIEVDGDNYTGHCGGIATFEGNAWVVSGKYARRISLDALKEAENEDSLQFMDQFNTGTRASYANCTNGILWVGEYHKDGDDYVTEDTHHLTSPNGEAMSAWTCGYVLESGNPQGFDYDGNSKSIVAPDFILETESMCQGFTQLPDGRFVTSISGEITKSELNFYENVLDGEADDTVTVSGKEVDLFFLDSAKQVDSLNALPRSEGVDVYGGKLLVLYESGCRKMLAAQIVRTDYVWSVEI